MDTAHALLGLTEYEARLYRALLTESPATAYRAGKASGVPLSRAYETAERLVQKGAANRLEGEPARYVPIPPADLARSARARAADALDVWERDLAAVASGTEATAAVWVRGEAAVVARATEMARAGGVTVAAGPAAAAALYPLRRQRGVRFVPVPEMRDGAAFAVVAADHHVLVGTVSEPASALLTRDRTLAAFVMAGVAARAANARTDARAGWLDWEEEKQRRLLASDDLGLPTQAH